MEEIKILDKGLVKLVDMLGSDRAAVRAARVSYGKELSTDERDKKLIFYLMEHKHHSPFEHQVFTFHIKTPIFIARQWMRHRIGSYNEISRRYTTKYAEEFYIPDHIRVQDTKNKQGSNKIEDENLTREALDIIQKIYEETYNAYNKLMELGVAREMARMVLPVGQYTQFYWTVNTRSLMNFLNLRADSHAQWEIQQYAIAVAKIFKEKLPWTYEAFMKFEYRGDLLK
ncbi:thymidylate synthase [Marinitoga sp. 1135]|uniref:Flavin-dependent thymidylate synthase n=1 Tax=Marinitoga piezophila (strain DSM 14283 / JCM 11233 / KA3) TaxID=443254 RepID=H2J6Q1_MARPK|nr:MULTISPECIES: FAD-dependent thymidylate synthase [Marinitoga]AEX86332.1 thymidylate synthase, flavin-dependent [Marinitoga piezophila KA3]APT76730.1 thymidylate synthase [Marinitoga sp. 1137]NUU96507.1 thymidylate synthase [Marinitoga sp. 1135]NUU98426.1 thymidylate synthase [Marinitoga sp. 1138]